MKIQEFRGLTADKQVELVNNRLAEIKENSLTVNEFKNDILEFSYSTAIKEMEKLGYAREKDKFEKELKLTEYEIRMLKNLAYGYEFCMKHIEEEPKVSRRPNDQLTTTSMRVYNKVWKRWQEFSKEWGIYNSVDLMASAMEQYMDKHQFSGYDELVKQGKIKE